MNEQPSTFHYANNGERIGPVPMDQLSALVQNGVITDSTLVWNEALTDWKPFAEYRRIVERGYARCAVSGALRPLAEMVQFGDQYVSAEHRDAFFQRVKEGVGGLGTLSVDPVELNRALDEEGFHTSAGSLISRSFALWKNSFGLVVGVVIVGSLIGGIAGQIPILGLLATILLQPHLNAGIQLVITRKYRGEEVAFDKLFDPLKNHYGTLVLYGLICAGIALVVIAVIIGIFLMTIGSAALFGGMESGSEPSGAALAAAIIPALCLGLLIVFVYVRLSFAPILIADKGLGLGDAMRLSWKASGMRIWPIIGALIVLSLLAMLGLLALIVGILVTMALPYIGISIAYDDAFGSRGRAS